VPPAEFTHLRDREIADAAQPRSQVVHGGTRYRLTCPAVVAAREAGSGPLRRAG
jgi:hypothetical protein